MKNLSKFYYKDYFKGIKFDFLLEGGNASEAIKSTIKQRNKDLCSTNLHKIIQFNPLTNIAFTLQLAYPGLVTGVGINNERIFEGAINLGVHFDYTWGMHFVYCSYVNE